MLTWSLAIYMCIRDVARGIIGAVELTKALCFKYLGGE